MKKLKLYFLLLSLIIINTLFIKEAFSQEIGIKISVLAFENSKNIKEYDYLSQSLQQSIYTSISKQEGIKLIPNSESSRLGEEYNLTADSISENHIPTILRFALEAKINVIVGGSYTINLATDEISVKTFAYSIAQKETVMDLNFDGEIGSEIYSLIDNISITTSTELKKRKEEIEIALESIMKDIKAPEYTEEINIKEIDLEGIDISWKTDKETVSTLYIGTEPNFNTSEAVLSLKDLSDDAINHITTIDYESIDIKKKYYIKSIDEDFFENIIQSKEININYDTIKNTLTQSYENETKELYKEMKEYINKKDFKSALESYEKIINEYNEKYWKVIELAETKEECEIKQEKLKNAQKVIELINIAKELYSDKDYELALSNYEKALSIIIENELENLIEVEPIEKEIEKINAGMDAIKVAELVESAEKYLSEENYKKSLENYEEALSIITEKNLEDKIEVDPIKKQIERVKSAIIIIELVEEGDRLVEESKYKAAVKKYKAAIEMIEKKAIKDLIPINNIQTKMNEANKKISRMYVNFGGGLGMNISSLDLIPSWQASFNFRIGHFFTIGFGINYLSIDLFTKFSFVNTDFHELVLKTGFEVSIIPLVFLDSPTTLYGVGGIGLIEYNLRFKGGLSIFIDLGIYISYYFENDQIPNISPESEWSIKVYPIANFGIGFNF